MEKEVELRENNKLFSLECKLFIIYAKTINSDKFVINSFFININTGLSYYYSNLNIKGKNIMNLIIVLDFQSK